MFFPIRLNFPDVLAAMSVGASSLFQPGSEVHPAWSVIAVIATGVTTYLLGRASNRKILADADRIKQETTGLMLRNARDLIVLKEDEVQSYRARFDQQAEESRKLTVHLADKITHLEVQIEALTKVIEQLKSENAYLSSMLTKRLRTLFLTSPDGDVQLILHPVEPDKSGDRTPCDGCDPDSDETVVNNP